MNKLSFCGLTTAISLAVLGCAQAASADDAPQVNAMGIPQSEVDSGSAYLFGNWDGERARLENEGVLFQTGFVDEAAHNFTGGDRRLTRNTSQLALGSVLDLDKLFDWRGGLFRIAVSDRNGRNLLSDANMASSQLVQEVYGSGQTWWISEFWLQQSLLDDRLSIRAGRLQSNSEFGHLDCDFQNLSFCGPQGANLFGYWIGWPKSVWAVRGRLATTTNTYVMLGVYQDNPIYNDDNYAVHHGLELNNPAGTLGALIPLEFGWTPTLRDLPGSYKFGAWYNTGGGNDLFFNSDNQPLAIDGGTADHRNASYGGYIAFKQQLTGTAYGDGATAFFSYTQGDHATSQNDRQLSMGVEYKGIRGRPDDVVGVGLAATHYSTYYAQYARLYNRVNPGNTINVGGGYEKTAEVFYGWQALPSLTFRPNLQYVVDPGGSNVHNKILVLGLKTLVNF